MTIIGFAAMLQEANERLQVEFEQAMADNSRKCAEIQRLRAALKTLVDESERVALSERKEWRPLVHLERAIEQAKTALDAAGG